MHVSFLQNYVSWTVLAVARRTYQIEVQNPLVAPFFPVAQATTALSVRSFCASEPSPLLAEGQSLTKRWRLIHLNFISCEALRLNVALLQYAWF